MTHPPSSSVARQLRLGAGITLTTLAMVGWHTVLAFAAPGDPIDKPDPSQAKNAPGVGGLKDLANALTLYVLLACLIGGLISALAAAFGGAISERVRETGKMGIVASVAIAFVAGVLWAIINWAYGAGANQ